MKLYYISTTSFSDCDANLLHHLASKFDIIYGVVIPYKNANYSVNQLDKYCKTSQITLESFLLKYRYRDIRNIYTYFSLIKSVIKEKPDIILFNNFDQMYFNLLFSFMGTSNTIVAVHDVTSHSGTKFNLLATLSRNLLYTRFNNFLTFSSSQSKLLKNKLRNKQINVIPLALLDFGSKPDRGAEKRKIEFLFFGNIKSYKGLDILLKSVGRLSKQHDSFRLTIAGRCEDWEETYEPLIVNSSLINKQVRFIDNDEVASFFGNADYLILPYRNTTQSGPLMIAYNYDIPVIASDIDGFREFIQDGYTGFLFNPDDEQSLDRVLSEAITRDQKSYLALCTHVGVYKQDKLSSQRMVESYTNMFESVLKNA